MYTVRCFVCFATYLLLPYWVNKGEYNKVCAVPLAENFDRNVIIFVRSDRTETRFVLTKLVWD